jgi:hypothetical protein
MRAKILGWLAVPLIAGLLVVLAAPGREALLRGGAFLGIAPLLTFLFSLRRPAPLTRKILWLFIAPAACWLWGMIATAGKGFSPGRDEALILVYAMPPLAALLMSLSGTRAMADCCAPGPGISMSLLNAAGCPGLTAGVFLLYFPGTGGEGGLLLAYVALFGGGAAAFITLAFAFITWKKRLSPGKIQDLPTGPDAIRGGPAK